MAALVAAADDLMNLMCDDLQACDQFLPWTARQSGTVLERFVRALARGGSHLVCGRCGFACRYGLSRALLRMRSDKSAILSSTGIDPRVQAGCLRQIEQQPEVSGVWTWSFLSNVLSTSTR
jgi:hypothetical protein